MDHYIPALLKSNEQFQTFRLELRSVHLALLPSEQELIMNTGTGHYVLINWSTRCLLLDGSFSQDELHFILPLLNFWPSFVPHDKLLQSVTQQPLALVTQLLDSRPDQALAVLHRLAECCRNQMHPYGIEVQNVGNLGYKLGRFVDKAVQA